MIYSNEFIVLIAFSHGGNQGCVTLMWLVESSTLWKTSNNAFEDGVQHFDVCLQYH